MARLLTSTWASGSITSEGWDPLSGWSGSIVNDADYGSGKALQVSGQAGSPNGVYSVAASFSDLTGYYFRTLVKIDATPAADTPLFGFGGSLVPQTSVHFLGMKSGSRAVWLNANNAWQGSAGPTLAINTVYTGELYCLFSSGSTGVITGRVDGTEFASQGGLFLQAGVPDIGVGTSAGITVRYGDVAINDNTGAANNSWVGPVADATMRPGRRGMF